MWVSVCCTPATFDEPPGDDLGQLLVGVTRTIATRSTSPAQE